MRYAMSASKKIIRSPANSICLRGFMRAHMKNAFTIRKMWDGAYEDAGFRRLSSPDKILHRTVQYGGNDRV